MSAKNSYDPAVSVTRAYDAPRKLVFDAWTRPEHLERWFAPRPFTIAHCEIDLRPGGRFRYAMRAPDGAEHWVTSTYDAVVTNERLAMTTRFDDLPDLAFEQTVTFVDQGGKTVVTFAMVFPEATRLTPDQLALLSPRANGATMGATMALAQLAELLAT